MTLGFLFGSRNFCKLLWVSCEVFVFHGYDRIHWVAKSCTKTAHSLIVSRFTPFTENFVSCCNQSTTIFCTRYGSAIASSARGPCNLGPLTDLAISVLMEISTNTVLTQILTSLGCGLQRILHDKELACESRVFRNSFIHKMFSEFLQPLSGCRNKTALAWQQTTGLPVLSGVSSKLGF